MRIELSYFGKTSDKKSIKDQDFKPHKVIKETQDELKYNDACLETIF